MAQLLLDKGADVNETALLGKTPLHLAVESRNLALVQLLLSHGADVNTNGPRYPGTLFAGSTPLNCAMRNEINTTFYGMARLLIGRGADLTKTDERGNTPLHIAAGQSGNNSLQPMYALQKIYMRVKLLLEHGASVNMANSYGITPLQIASRREEIKPLKCYCFNTEPLPILSSDISQQIMLQLCDIAT